MKHGSAPILRISVNTMPFHWTHIYTFMADATIAATIARVLTTAVPAKISDSNRTRYRVNVLRTEGKTLSSNRAVMCAKGQLLRAGRLFPTESAEKAGKG